jgi:hypothetical protein
VRLILTTEDGTVLDAVEVTPDDWLTATATATPMGAWCLLDDLTPGPLPSEQAPEVTG